jgi:hypothetical protein
VLRLRLMVETRSAFAAASSIRRRSATWIILPDWTFRSFFDARCIGCHSCYNAPCQLNLQSYSRVARGATNVSVAAAPRSPLRVRARNARRRASGSRLDDELVHARVRTLVSRPGSDRCGRRPVVVFACTLFIIAVSAARWRRLPKTQMSAEPIPGARDAGRTWAQPQDEQG